MVNNVYFPRKAEFFPDLNGQVVYDCVDKTIKVRSQKGYILYIRFEKYQDPLENLNNFLRSIQKQVNDK